MPQRNYKFTPPPTDQGNNRVNTSRESFVSTEWRGSQRYVGIIAPGQTLPVPISGTQFYLRTATAEVSIRPNKGTFSRFVQGEGMNFALEGSFSILEVQNNNSVPVVIDLFAGFQGFIDNKLILQSSLYPQVVFPTYPTANVANQVNFVDLSGTQFTDINGGKWYALSRIAILISNVDTGATFLIQKEGSVVSGGPAILAIFPATSIRLDVSGNYTMSTGGGNINVIGSEIYAAVSATPPV